WQRVARPTRRKPRASASTRRHYNILSTRNGFRRPRRCSLPRCSRTKSPRTRKPTRTSSAVSNSFWTDSRSGWRPADPAVCSGCPARPTRTGTPVSREETNVLRDRLRSSRAVSRKARLIGPRGDGPQRARVDGNGAESALRIPASACFPVTETTSKNKACGSADEYESKDGERECCEMSFGVPGKVAGHHHQPDDR